MGMFDELIFHDMVDMGRLVPPIIPHLIYQTKDFEQILRKLDVRGNEIDVSGVRGFQDRATDCSDVLSAKQFRFYTGPARYEQPLFDEFLSKATEEEISKALFFTDLFCHDWLEYDVDLYRGKITRINAVYTGYGSNVAWTRKGY